MAKLEALLGPEHTATPQMVADVDAALKVLGRQIVGESPNPSYLNGRFQDYEQVLFNVKNLGYELGRVLATTYLSRPVLAPPAMPLASKLCTQSDIESDWFLFWCAQMKAAPLYHRKLWEFAYIIQVLWHAGKMREGQKGLGFGCGEEPLPSLFAKYGAEILVTDLAPSDEGAAGWTTTGQHASAVASVRRKDLCPDESKLANISLEYVDMNNVPVSLNGRFDFCWSACALEHLGSIAKGLGFIERSLETLRPGGVAVHTTEFSLGDGETIDNMGTVFFQKAHMTRLADALTRKGFVVAPFDFSTGSGILDGFVDVAPFTRDDVFLMPQAYAHLRLSIAGAVCTSFGIVITRP